MNTALDSSILLRHPVPVFQISSALQISASIRVASCACCGVIRPIENLGECARCGAFLCGMDGCVSECSCEQAEA
jgi:hypothetical protein